MILNFRSKIFKKIKKILKILGGKGANLSAMGRLKMPVPPGFKFLLKFVIYFIKIKKIKFKNY